MCVFDGKTWTFGRMLGHSVSDLQLEQTLYALWITNKTKMGQGQKINCIVIINLVSSSNTSFSQTIIQQSWYSYKKYNYTHIIRLLTNWSLDCIFHNNCRQFSWRHRGDWNCRWIIGFIDRLALWPQFWGNRYRYVWCHNPLRTPHSRTMSVVSLIIPSRIMGVRNQCLKIRFAMGWEGHFLYAFQAV